MNKTALTVQQAPELPSTMSDAQAIVLSQATPREAIRQKQGRGGKLLSYVDHAYVTGLLNRAFGHNWDFEVTWHDVVFWDGRPFEANCLGRLTVRVPDPHSPGGYAAIVKTQFGCQPIDMLKDGSSPVSVGDALKGSGSDALKKCASLLGIALDLYDSDSDAAQGRTRSGPSPRAQAPTPAGNAGAKSQPAAKPQEAPAPAQATQPEEPAGNGQAGGSGPVISTGRWKDAVIALAKSCPHYAHLDDPAKGPNFWHAAMAAQGLGFQEVTDANLDQVIAALLAHGNEALADRAAVEAAKAAGSPRPPTRKKLERTPPVQAPAKAKSLAINTKRWAPSGKELSAAFPAVFLTAKGVPDLARMATAALEMGYTHIDDANLDEVLDSLSTWARQAAAA